MIAIAAPRAPRAASIMPAKKEKASNLIVHPVCVNSVKRRNQSTAPGVFSSVSVASQLTLSCFANQCASSNVSSSSGCI